MANMMKVIDELAAINRIGYMQGSDMITIDKHENNLYIYSRHHVFTDTMFQLSKVVKVLLDNDVNFFLTSAQYGFPTVLAVGLD